MGTTRAAKALRWRCLLLKGASVDAGVGLAGGAADRRLRIDDLVGHLFDADMDILHARTSGFLADEAAELLQVILHERRRLRDESHSPAEAVAVSASCAATQGRTPFKFDAEGGHVVSPV